MEPIKQNDYQQDNTQEQLIELYSSNSIPATLVALASPGTGKTTTISRIIEKIVLGERKQTKSNFLVLTFTRKTRFDLIHKFRTLQCNYQTKKYVRNRIKNFHSFAYDIIKWKEIIDSDAQANKIDSIIRQFRYDAPALKSFRKEAVRVKDKLLSDGATDNEWNQLINRLKTEMRTRYISIFLSEYKQWLEKEFQLNNKVTYDHSLLKTIEAIDNGSKPKHGSIDLEALQLIIVDEFQDSNPAQLKIVDALIKRSKKQVKILLVGDFDQNIYTWRGADIQFIDQFIRKREYNIMNLGNSYRMGEHLTELSQKLIKSCQPYSFFRNRFYRNYVLHARGKYNNEPEVRTFEFETTEVKWIIDKIYEHMSQQIPLGEMTILVRTTKNNFFKLLLEEIKLRKQQGCKEILYEVKIYNDVLNCATVKYLFAIFSYFKKVGIDETEEEIRRITHPIDFVGEKDEVRNELFNHKKISRDLLHYDRIQNYMENRKKNWNLFFNDWEKIEKIVKQPSEKNFLEVCKEIFQILRLAQWGNLELQESKIYEFLDAAEEMMDSMDQAILKIDPIFSVFHELSQLMNKKASDEGEHDSNDMLIRKRRDRLQIQTIHTSKGLQFEVVFLGSLNYEFPKFYKKNPFSIEPETQREEIQNLLWEEEAKEELRVIYTALTRSSRYSYVSSSLKFYKPTWLYNYKEHPQFKFLKANAKYCGLVPKSYEHTRSIYERSELRGEEEAEEELIQMMERHSIN